MGTVDEKQGARVDYKSKSRKLLHQYYEIAESLVLKAHTLSTSGEDVRGNEQREGLSTLMHAAEKAIGEIVRLTPMCGVLETENTTAGETVGYHHDPEKEQEMLAFVPDA